MTLRGNPTTRKINGDGARHGSAESSGGDSMRSTDTVRGPFGNFSAKTPVRVNTNKKLQ